MYDKYNKCTKNTENYEYPIYHFRKSDGTKFVALDLNEWGYADEIRCFDEKTKEMIGRLP